MFVEFAPRRKLAWKSSAVFEHLYVDDDLISDHNLREPFNRLHAAQHAATLAKASYSAD